MHCRRVQTLKVEERDRRIDQEAEDPSTQHVPESHRNEAHHRPTQAFCPRSGMLIRPMFIGFVAQEHERHHFQGGEHSTHTHTDRGHSREVKVVHRAWHATDQEDRGSGQGAHRGRAQAHKTEVVEHKGNGSRSKHFKEAFHPEVNHPPAPVFHDGKRGMFAVEETRAIEETHTHHGGNEDRQEVTVRIFVLQSVHGAAEHQEEPEQEAHKEHQLPEATNIQEFIALMTEPEVQVLRQGLSDSE